MKKLFFLISVLIISLNSYSRPLAKHVFLFGLDGWSSKSYEKAQIPNIRSLAEKGCITFKKRSIMPSSSAQNWATMFMGVGPEIHGYTNWWSEKPEVPSMVTNENGIFPTIFYLLKEQRPKNNVSVFYEWKGIKHLIDSVAVDYHKLSEYDNGDLSKKACEYMEKNTPNLMAVIWDGLDHAGHGSGYCSEVYMNEFEKIDTWIGEVIQATKEAGIYDESIFIITGDHGGIEKKHGGITDEEMHTPFIISGEKIKSGKQITTPMIQYDIAATIAYIFDLKVPSIWTGKPIKEVFK